MQAIKPQTRPIDIRDYQVRCPTCNALQFISPVRWELTSADRATLAIKCWRRTCKRVLCFRIEQHGD